MKRILNQGICILLNKCIVHAPMRNLVFGTMNKLIFTKGLYSIRQLDNIVSEQSVNDCYLLLAQMTIS